MTRNLGPRLSRAHFIRDRESNVVNSTCALPLPPQCKRNVQRMLNVYSMCTFLHLQRSITSGFPHYHVTPTRDTHVTSIVTWIPGGYTGCWELYRCFKKNARYHLEAYNSSLEAAIGTGHVG